MRIPLSIARRVALLAALVAPSVAGAQIRPPQGGAVRPGDSARVQQTALFDSSALAALTWREIGPYRGGRSVAVAGSQARPLEYYMGTTGGGVFKTVDGGRAWAPVTDRYFGGTIGAIAVAPSNPDIVYVGGGEYPIRGNVSHGDGVWKSTDGGRTWTSMGLVETRQIADVVVHPTNPEVVYVGALGHVWAPNAERGVYRSRDGGRTWTKVLHRNDSTGVGDLVMDPNDPNTLYAGFWQAGRTPWMLSSGGAGSGLWKTTDGGDTWTEITRNPGLPAGIWGNIGITVSRARSTRLYAIIEADSGGVFRSDDGGRSWTKTNSDRALRQRAWYYTKIHADPRDTNVVYVNNVAFHKSTDGGRTFRPVRIPHSDSHDLWIAPDDPNRMIEADDGGAAVSTDGGRTWTEQDYATAQFYHVITTNHFPYRICGAQQDNSTLCGPSRTQGAGIAIGDWEDAGGGESGYIAPRHDDPDIVYAGSYGGLLTRKDMRTGLERNVNPWPENPMGHPAGSLRYRFQWTFPIVTSRHSPDVVYATSNVVHRSNNGGRSWQDISRDLTRRDPRTLGNSGGPITRDQTSVEYYATIFAFAESPVRGAVLWAGSDDGLVHVTRDGGATWRNVTPPDMEPFTRVSIIEASHHDAGTAYVAANRFQLDDMRPYLWKTTDYGATWRRIDAGLPIGEFTRVIREDPERRGLLFAGTERSVYYSLNDGAGWHSLRRNLPLVPVHDIAIKEGDVVLGTHGRSFYVMDDISTLRQLADSVVTRRAHLFAPRDQYRVVWGGRRGGGGGGAGMMVTPQNAPAQPVGANPPSGATVHYWLREPAREVVLEFRDARGTLVRRFTSLMDSASRADSVRRADVRRSRMDSLRNAGVTPDSIQRLMRATPDQPAPGDDDGPPRPAAAPRAPNRAGTNSFTWNMRYPDASTFEGMILWAASVQGPVAPPGTYQVRLIVDSQHVATRSFRLLADPRLRDVTPADYAEQFAFAMRVRDRFSAANDGVRKIRWLRHELQDRQRRMPTAQQAAFGTLTQAFLQALGDVEDSLYQTKNRSGQDPLNYPIRLNNKVGALMGVVAGAQGRPTAQSYAVFNHLSAQLDRELRRLEQTVSTMLPRVNAALRAASLPVVEAKVADPPRAAGSGAASGDDTMEEQ